jgi:organic radical activating enzyme
MHGKNPIRQPVLDDGSHLEVKNIFATLQGEGLYVGVPSVFIRLGGCNLACNFCDTEFENAPTIPLTDIIQKTGYLAVNNEGERVRKLVVITGGEPFRQNIVPLCKLLLDDGFAVQIETNGTLYRELPPEVDIVCSPKNTGNGYTKIRDDLLARVSALKFIISAYDEKYKNVGEVGQDLYDIPVYVQPMDEGDNEKNEANRQLALTLAMQYGYRMSIQTHKILNIE